MAEIINIVSEIPESHVVCGECENDTFIVKVLNDHGVWKYNKLICSKCEHSIFVCFEPLEKPISEGKDG